MKDFINSHLRALVAVAWFLALALAMGIHWLIVKNLDNIRMGYYELITYIIIGVTFLTFGIRLFPCFREGLFGSCKNNKFVPWIIIDPVVKPAETSPSVDAMNRNNEEQDIDDDVEKGEKIANELNEEQQDNKLKDDVAASNNNAQQKKQESKKSTERMYFLDNVKIFLTAVVVSHHVTCQFTGDGVFGIKIGIYDNLFKRIFQVFLGLDQSYFMALFFFISAYFTPSSYDRKGKDLFIFERAKRLFIPAFIVTFGVMPLTSLIGHATAGGGDLQYYSYGADAGPTWFIYWLLLFCFIYHSFRVVTKKNRSDDIGEGGPTGFPVFWKRWIAGAVVCGLLMWAFAVAYGGPDNSNPTTARGSFYTMPISSGSFTCDVLFFGVGTIAARNEWLSVPIVSSWWSNILLLVVALIDFFLAFGAFVEIIPLAWIFIGMYSVDMSTFILSFFQTYFNTKPGKFGRFLSQSAYTVYLIHPLVITGFTSAFIKIYNLIYGDVIQFEEGSTESSSHLLGPGDGSLALFVGWLIVTVLSLLVLWPLSYAIRSLPGFREIL